jgi:hypothetical protein
MAVMGNGDIVVSKLTPGSRQSIVEDQAENTTGPRRGPIKPRQQQMCGAMTQQGTDNHSPSQQQEFVRLVGYRDPKARPPGGG